LFLLLVLLMDVFLRISLSKGFCQKFTIVWWSFMLLLLVFLLDVFLRISLARGFR
jgi:hypothetical protein